MKLDDWQAKVMDDRSPRIIANTSRQIGKSTVVSAKVWHHVWYGYRRLVLLVAPTLRQSIELIRKVKYFALESGCPKDMYKMGALNIEIPHTQSRIIALPGGNPANIRGFSGPSMVAIDEASFAKDELYHSITPMFATSEGQLILTSTPFLTRGFFYDIATKSDMDLGEAWSRYTVPAWESPRIRPKFLDARRVAMGEWWFNSEFGCKFQEPQNALFTFEMIEAAKRKILAPLYDSEATPSKVQSARALSPLYQ
jgi:hypothetical protein